MQAVILAAGESSRFWPLNKKHKSLFKIMGQPLVWYTLENLKKAGIIEIIIVQNPKRDVENELKHYKLPSNLKIKYVLQKTPLGTGHALKSAENYLKERFLVLNGDDLYGVEDIKKCLSKFPAILVKEVSDPTNFGVIVPEKNWVKEIVEKSEKPPTKLVNIGCYFLPKKILKEKINKSLRGEYEIIDYLRNLIKKTKLNFLKAQNWFPLSYVWDLLDINEYLLKDIKTKIAETSSHLSLSQASLHSVIKGKVEKNCHIKGLVVIERGTIIKSGTYIEGPVYIGKNCQLGPNCLIRPFSSIDDNCIIGQGVEIKNSIIAMNSHISHLNYVADSIIGDTCNLGAGTILANLRFDGKNVQSVVKGKPIDTQRRKFGAVFGKGVKTGVNVSVMPGVLIGQNSIIGPHCLVTENIKDNETFYTKFQKNTRGIDKF